MSILIPEFTLYVSTFDYVLQIHQGTDILASQVVRIGPLADFGPIPAADVLASIDGAMFAIGGKMKAAFPSDATFHLRRRPVMDAMIPSDYVDVTPPAAPVEN